MGLRPGGVGSGKVLTVGPRGSSVRAAALAQDLRDAASRLTTVLEDVPRDRWNSTADASTWSIGKDVEHVGDASLYHQWIVRLTVGEKVASRRPPIERQRLTSSLSREDAIGLVRERTEEAARLIGRLTDAQLALPTKPPRARGQALGDAIALILIGHYDTHRRDIERKLG